MIYLDTETVGLFGVPVLIQWAEDDGPVQLHEIWREPAWKTLELIEYFCEREICGFNLAFDFFHLYKIYTMFLMLPDKDVYPDQMIHELGIIEERARFCNLVIKPKAALDLMLHARKGPFQSLMEREDIKIRRVPTALAWQLAKELERRIVFDDIYFANAKDKLAPKWKVYDIKKPDGTINPDFKDIKLRFKASGSLKNLYRHIFKVKEPILKFTDVEIDRQFWPEELGYAPFALALAPNAKEDFDWKQTWPTHIRAHIRHWAFMSDARKYAADDVNYTRAIAKHFGNPKPGDNDSELACMVAVNRWRGFAINVPKLRALRERAVLKIKETPMAPSAVKRWVFSSLSEIEIMATGGSTKKVVLEEISNWKDECECGGLLSCEKCKGTGEIPHPAALKARAVLDARIAAKEIELYDKLLKAKRFHASFKVIGTLSSRMAGADGLNPQGIKHQKYVRECFPLADSARLLSETFGLSQEKAEELAMVLSGGDFKSFEVTLAAAVFKDPELDNALNSGKKIHALLGMELFPGKSYQDILDSEGTDDDMYDKGKKGVFLMFYGGDANTFKNKLGIPLEIGEAAFQRFLKKHKKIGDFNQFVQTSFGALVQPGGIGSRVEWREPADYAESFLGFRRYFTLENKICRALFEMAEKPPAHWKNIQIKVMRRDRLQTAAGACQSALFGAAFGIVSGIIRAAKNHYIQSPGAEITKATQRAIWDLQPVGVHPWRVMAMNIHDELMAPNRNMQKEVESKVKETVAFYKKQVPLLAIDWVSNISSWAGKKGEPNVTGTPSQNVPAASGPQK